MKHKYLNLSEEFWVTKYLQYIVPKSEVCLGDYSNSSKIVVDSFSHLKYPYQYTFKSENLKDHINLLRNLNKHLNYITIKNQQVIKDLIYEDLKTPSSRKKLDNLDTPLTIYITGGVEQRQSLQNELISYYSQNLDNEIIQKLDTTEQFFLNPYKLLNYSHVLPDFPNFFDNQSYINLAMNIKKELPLFKESSTIIDNDISFLFWNIQVGNFFEILGNVTRIEDRFVTRVEFRRMSIF